MLRLFLAWRLMRMLLVLLLFGFAALALTSALNGGPRALGRERSSLAHAASSVERALNPLVSDARHALTQALARAQR